VTATLAIARKELRVYFVSPLFYVVTGLFVLGWGFFEGVYIVQNQADQPDAAFFYATLLLVFLAPLLTMRLIAQERQQGTIELLMTNPVRDIEVVAGKFLAALAMVGVMLAVTFVAVLLLMWTATDRSKVLGVNLGVVDWSAVGIGYLGNLLIFSAYAGIGIFASSVTRNQILAAVIGIVILLVLVFGMSYASGSLTSPVSDIATYLSPQTHAENFAKGVFALPDLMYALTMTLVPLYLAVVSLSARKWH